MSWLRAILADLLLAFAAICDRIDTHYADLLNGADDE